MLGKLVNKFKRQTLQDGNGSSSGGTGGAGSGGGTTALDGCVSPNGARRSARLNEKAEKEKGGNGGSENTLLATMMNSPSPPNTRSRRAQQQLLLATSQELVAHHHQQQQRKQRADAGGGGQMTRTTSCITTRTMAAELSAAPPMAPSICDSGTESDDDELEMLDSLSNASRAGDIIMCSIGRSPPTLTSSPPLISEIDTNSWDSCGCESGIVLRDSAERDDASRNLDLLEAAFGGGELVMEINKPGGGGKKNKEGEMMADDIVGTTPVQSKDAFPAHFLRSTAAHPMPIDFSTLRHAELSHAGLLSSSSSAHLNNNNNTCAAANSDDAPTPIGSQKGPGQGAMLMEMAQLEKQQQQQQQQQQQGHQGAFRRVLRRTRRNSNSQQQQAQQQQQAAAAAMAAARTTSPLGIGLGEKRRWDAPVVVPPPTEQQQQPEAATTATTTTALAAQLEEETLPIATRTRNGLMMGLMSGLGSGGAGAIAATGGQAGHHQQLDTTSGAANDANSLNRLVLTAARRTRVRVLYSAAGNGNGNGNNGTGVGGGPFMMPTTMGTVPLSGRRGQVAPMLGQSPPNMLVANKRGRHCSKSSNSPPRPSLNFDKMRTRMLSNTSNNNGGAGAAGTGQQIGAGGNNGGGNSGSNAIVGNAAGAGKDENAKLE